MNTDREKAIGEVIQFVRSIKPFTVGDLRKAIDGLPDDVHVLMAETPKGSNSDWFNVSHEIGIPSEDSDYSALTFFPVDDFDARQF